VTTTASRASNYLNGFAEAISAVDPHAVTAMCETLWKAWCNDQTLFVMGNGGSASTADHVACDLGKQTMVAGRHPMRVVALTSNAALISAWANDAGYSRVFSEQIRVLGRPGDLLLSISCSGNSPNLLAAIDEARRRGMSIMALGGLDGGHVRHQASVYVHVPANDYGCVESAHLAIVHCLAALLRETARSAMVAGRDCDPSKPAVVLDRDGVINRNLSDGIRCWEDFSFLPGSKEALADLARNGQRIVIVTNQANVGRGKLSVANLEDINRRMVDAIIEAGGAVDAVYTCTHSPQAGCDCRKPAPGLLRRAAADLGFDLTRAYVVGDHITDVAAAKAVGAVAVLVLSGRTTAVDDGESPAPDVIVPDLAAVVPILKSSSRPGRDRALAMALPMPMDSDIACIGSPRRTVLTGRGG